ncbi:MAG: 50S ribosomal protein L9 [Pseudobdellovibrionaceae bacterium]|jgi:large subunit ribosomal protein L9
MKVILVKDVKDVGKVGDLVNVAEGFARNFLFPRKLASEATEKRVKEWEHLKRVADAKRKKAVEERKALLTKISGTSLKFKAAAGETDKLFGTVTTTEISKELTKAGFSVDRRDIHLEEPIKVLGNHKAWIRFGEGLEAQIQVVVERA